MSWVVLFDFVGFGFKAMFTHIIKYGKETLLSKLHPSRWRINSINVSIGGFREMVRLLASSTVGVLYLTVNPDSMDAVLTIYVSRM